jgi:hypothetical protein
MIGVFFKQVWYGMNGFVEGEDGWMFWVGLVVWLLYI